LKRKANSFTQIGKPSDRGATDNPVQSSLWEESLPIDGPESREKKFERRTIQDVLFNEGLLAVRASADVSTLRDLQDALTKQLGQNSKETRERYAESILLWYFSDGLNGLARRVWMAYKDEKIETDILRYIYLAAEPVMGRCVAEALFPLENGMQIPPEYFDQYLKTFFGVEPPPKTKVRLKSNLMKIGLLDRARGKPDRLKPVIPARISLLILLYHLFSQKGPRTIELCHLLANPFWKFLGYKSEDAVRAVLHEANAAGFLSKYIVADQLEQVTTSMSADEFLIGKVHL